MLGSLSLSCGGMVSGPRRRNIETGEEGGLYSGLLYCRFLCWPTHKPGARASIDVFFLVLCSVELCSPWKNVTLHPLNSWTTTTTSFLFLFSPRLQLQTPLVFSCYYEVDWCSKKKKHKVNFVLHEKGGLDHHHIWRSTCHLIILLLLREPISFTKWTLFSVNKWSKFTVSKKQIQDRIPFELDVLCGAWNRWSKLTLVQFAQSSVSTSCPVRLRKHRELCRT